MSTITTKDGTEIYYKDWGSGPVVTFSHGWPLNSDAWDGQMLFLAQHGFRVMAHDRRGHGRSSQPTSGNDMNGYADDLAALIEALDLKDVTLVGHSTGGGEVARYIGRHGTKRVAKAVLIAAVPPVMVKSEANPEGLPIEAFDAIRAGLVKDRSQFYRDLAPQFYGANRPGSNVSQGTLDQFWLWSMQAGLLNAYECVKAFSETDFTEDLKKFDVPTLVLHGEDDQIVPVKDSAVKSARLIKGAKDIYYPGAPHGITATHQDQVNADLLAFLRPDARNLDHRWRGKAAPFPFKPFPSSPFKEIQHVEDLAHNRQRQRDRPEHGRTRPRARRKPRCDGPKRRPPSQPCAPLQPAGGTHRTRCDGCASSTPRSRHRDGTVRSPRRAAEQCRLCASQSLRTGFGR
jgi:non-heme chloroperoxidase